MTAIEGPAPQATATTEAVDPDQARKHRLGFWIRRYLPAEVVGTAAMMLAGFGVTAWTDAPAVIGLAALAGETIGFYAVLTVTIYLEQLHVIDARSDLTRRRRRAGLRTLLLLAAEFGPAELLDTLLIRPAALMLGVWLIPDAFWGLLAGKVAADIVFYALAAGAFTITDRTGLRDAPKGSAS